MRAHPRSRGEHVDKATGEVTALGSSPLARGTHEFCFESLVDVGLIPARAGNTTEHDKAGHLLGAHPRSRGEHLQPATPLRSRLGSSPLARGTPRVPGWKAPVPGLIPARAGNTCQVTCLTELIRAHPRSRGEHRVMTTSIFSASGSSPLARGTPMCPV